MIVREVVEREPRLGSRPAPAMLISHAANMRVETPDEFAKAVADKERDVTLRLVRRARERPTWSRVQQPPRHHSRAARCGNCGHA